MALLDGEGDDEARFIGAVLIAEFMQSMQKGLGG
jgi:hypothetical protein